LAKQYEFARMEAALRHEHAWLILETGRSSEPTADSRVTSPDSIIGSTTAPREGSTIADLLLALTCARMLLVRGQPRDAIPMLRGWLTFTRRRHCVRAATRCGALLARVLLAAGDRRSALRTLGETLALAAPRGFVRTFVDEGTEIAALIAEVADQAAHSPAGAYARLLRQAFGHADDVEAGRNVRGTAQAGGQDVLTTREIQILELGARGMQNADIAQATFLAQSTVKWYWQRIFEKLAVGRRPDAIRRARENHWIR